MDACDEEVLERVCEAFSDCTKAHLIRDSDHCSECAEADTFLTSLEREDVRLATIGDGAGYDYFSMLTDEGFRFFLPGLCRMALAERPNGIWHLLMRLQSRLASVMQTHHQAALLEFLDYLTAMGYAETDDTRKMLRQVRAQLSKSK